MKNKNEKKLISRFKETQIVQKNGKIVATIKKRRKASA